VLRATAIRIAQLKKKERQRSCCAGREMRLERERSSPPGPLCRLARPVGAAVAPASAMVAMVAVKNQARLG
jgi:hypothetical protein